MAPPVEAQRKFFTLEEANRTLPLVRMIVSDIVTQYHAVNDLHQRLASLTSKRHKRAEDDPYAQEVAQSESELEAEEAKLEEYAEELRKLGVELKGQDGLCDFPSLLDGREIYLCWRLGEPEIQYWHDLHAGFAGRQPILAPTPSRATSLKDKVSP
jgi:hypothetical protein